MDYTDRKLMAVTISGVTFYTNRVSASVEIAVNTPEVEGAFGPHMTIRLSVPATKESTIESLQSELLSAASSLLNRLAQENVDSLQVSKAAWEAHLKKPVEVDLSALDKFKKK